MSRFKLDFNYTTPQKGTRNHISRKVYVLAFKLEEGYERNKMRKHSFVRIYDRYKK